MRLINILMLSAVMACSLLTISCSKDEPEGSEDGGMSLTCVKPDYLKPGDKVALISPSYYTPMENVDKTADVIRSWGLIPVIGPNVGKIDAGRYAGTTDERLSDIRWALGQPDVKAIICNRGGYGTMQLIDHLSLEELSNQPKWIVGFSDITTLLGLWNRAGLMSIHGTMSSFIAQGGTDATSTLMRDLLMGKVPRYEVPAHPQNIEGTATGTLVGGNLCTLTPNLGTKADATMGEDLILFIEEVEESMHNIDRQFNILAINGVMERCKGVVLGEFTDCGDEFSYESVEAMLCNYLKDWNIPVLCGFPSGHDNVNLPLVMGATVSINVRTDGASLAFNMEGEQQQVRTDSVSAIVVPQSRRLDLAGKK